MGARAGPSGLGVGAPSGGSSAYASPASSSSRSSLISATAAPGRNRVYPSPIGAWTRFPPRVGGGPYDRPVDLTPAQRRTLEQLIGVGSLPPSDVTLADRVRSRLELRLVNGGILPGASSSSCSGHPSRR